MILSRSRKPRAKRMADMQASVPELHIRTFSHAGNGLANQPRHPDFQRIGNAEAGPLPCRVSHRRDDFGMGMAQNGRPPRSDVIHVFISIHVEDMRACGAIDKKGLAAHGAEGPHRRIDAAGNITQAPRQTVLRIWFSNASRSKYQNDGESNAPRHRRCFSQKLYLVKID